MSRFEILFELLKQSNSENRYVKIAKGKHKRPTTIKEVIKHTRDGKRDKYRFKG